MRIVLKFILIVVVILGCSPVFSQRIVNNVLIFYIDDNYANTDTMVAKSNVNTSICYRCWKKGNGEDSCVLLSETIYDKKGRISRLSKGNNLSKGQPDFTVSYKWLSDSIMESMVDFSPGSTTLENFYIDSLIKGKLKRVCLYRADKNKHIPVRSEYKWGDGNMWQEIKRYDLDNKLVEIYYPLGNIVTKQFSQETVCTNYDSVITSSYFYDGYVNRMKEIYSKTGNLKEVWETGRTFDWPDSSISRSIRFYDREGRLVVKDDIDLNNVLTSEMRFYYKGDKLIRYTRDDNFSDSLFTEEKIYNTASQVIYSGDYVSANGSNLIFKYLYNERNLLTRQEFYINDELQYYERYEYK